MVAAARQSIGELRNVVGRQRRGYCSPERLGISILLGGAGIEPNFAAVLLVRLHVDSILMLAAAWQLIGEQRNVVGRRRRGYCSPERLGISIL